MAVVMNNTENIESLYHVMPRLLLSSFSLGFRRPWKCGRALSRQHVWLGKFLGDGRRCAEESSALFLSFFAIVSGAVHCLIRPWSSRGCPSRGLITRIHVLRHGIGLVRSDGLDVYLAKT